jgi:hypothetical protein
MICSRCRADQPLEAFAPNRAKASGYNSYCRPCMSAYAKERRKKPGIKEAAAAAQARYAAANPEKTKAATDRWRREHTDERREKVKGYTQAWRAANPERNRELARETYVRTKARCHANVAARRAHQHLAIAPWADLAAIKAIYAEAGRRNAKGEMVHVDHVIPLKHPLVCGLHCEANLEIVPALANWSKNNRHWPDMP